MGALVLFSDLQGNRLALEAILGHVKRRLPDAEVVLLGNAVGSGPDPAGTVALLRKRGVVLVKGERDFAALGLGKDPTLRLEGDANARRLTPADLAYLRNASPPRRLSAHGQRLLLTTQTGPGGAAAGETLVQPGEVNALAPMRVAIASTARSNGEAPFVVLDEQGFRLLHATWDAAAEVGRTRQR